MEKPYNNVWSPDKFCLLLQISDSHVLMSKLSNRYSLEIDDFLINTGRNTVKPTRGRFLTVFPNNSSPLGTAILTLSRLEVLP